MARETKVGIALAGSALGLGILGDVLFQGQPLGLNVALWTALFVIVLSVLLRISRAELHQGRRYMVAPLLLFFAGMFVWHDSPLLIAANFFALAAAVAMGALRRTQQRLDSATLSDYGGGAVSATYSIAAGAAHLLASDINWTELRKPGSDKPAAVARGVAIALPLLLLFGGLFVAADAVFKQLLSSVVPALSVSSVARGLVVLLFAWLAAGLLRDLLASREEGRLVQAEKLRLRRAAIRSVALEFHVALGLLVVLLVAFVVVQFRYLFGGRGLVEQAANLTYAKYARHGFFELVAVAALTLPVLLVGDWLLREQQSGRRAFRWLASALLALLAVVMLSALQRMRLYLDQYGLTELRLYTVGCILWLAVVCAWFALTVLRGRRHLFAVGALVAALRRPLRSTSSIPTRSLHARTRRARRWTSAISAN